MKYRLSNFYKNNKPIILGFTGLVAAAAIFCGIVVLNNNESYSDSNSEDSAQQTTIGENSAVTENIQYDFSGDPRDKSWKASDYEEFNFSCLVDNSGNYKDFKAEELVSIPDNILNLQVSPEEVYGDIESEIDATIQSLATNFGEQQPVEDRPSDVGDYITIDFIGKIDGREVYGASSEDHTVEIGSGDMIDGFEDGLVGLNVGDTKDITVTYPSDYGTSYYTDDPNTEVDLSNKTVVFTVTVKDIYQMIDAEITDEFVANNLSTIYNGVTTVDELREYFEDNIKQTKKFQYITEKLIAEAEFKGDIPNEVITYNYVSELANLAAYAKSASDESVSTNSSSTSASSEPKDLESVILETLKSYYDLDSEDAMLDVFYDDFVEKSRQQIFMQAVVNTQNIVVSEDAINEELKNLTGYEFRDLEPYYGAGYLYQTVRQQLAYDKIAEHLVAGEAESAPTIESTSEVND